MLFNEISCELFKVEKIDIIKISKVKRNPNRYLIGILSIKWNLEKRIKYKKENVYKNIWSNLSPNDVWKKGKKNDNDINIKNNLWTLESLIIKGVVYNVFII